MTRQNMLNISNMLLHKRVKIVDGFNICGGDGNVYVKQHCGMVHLRPTG